MSVDYEAPPYAFVTVEGEVILEEEADDLLLWATRIGGRYMGEDRAEEFGRRNAVPGELLARMTPQKVLAFGDIAGQ